MQEPRKWRELLGVIISNPTEKFRVADELAIHPYVLMHWVYGEANPTPQQLGLLLLALPEHQHILSPLIAEALEYFIRMGPDRASEKIPPAFYASVERVKLISSPSVRFWSLCRLILQQALSQLDPYRLGMAIKIVRCMPPSLDGMVRSLREATGLGTAPWDDLLDQQSMLLGIESIVGYAVEARQMVSIDTMDEHNPISLWWHEQAVSVCVCPIVRGEGVAGCFLVTSTQVDYFTSARLALIQSYTDLLASALETTEFYDAHVIMLGAMPPREVQRQRLTQHRQRVASLLIDAINNNRFLDIAQAELMVWQQFEREFLKTS